MAQKLLTQLISVLSPLERNFASNWLANSMHNSKPILKKIFDEAAEQHNLGISPNLEDIFNKQIPQAKAAMKRKLMHELLANLENCLVYLDITKDNWAYQKQLLSIYHNRSLKQHLQRRINQYRKSSPSQNFSAGEGKFQLHYRLEKEQYNLQTAQKRSDRHNLPTVETAMINEFLARRFRQACETLAHFRIFHHDFPPPLLNESLSFYASHPSPNLPGIHLFYLATLLYTESETDAIFTELKQGIDDNIDDFPPQDQRNLIVVAINHCLRQSNAGRLIFLRETLALYQLGLQRKCFYDNGLIGIFTFNNILGVALRLEEIDWAENFLEQNARRLPAQKREEVESLSRARLSFLRKDFDQTLHHLRTADYQDFIHHLTARVLQLKIYFARDDYNLLTSHIRSTKSLIKRRKNLGYHQRNYLNIFTLAEKIIKLPPSDRAAQQGLRVAIEATEPCTEKAWLLSQLPA